mmetsp:Transcript_45378/g.73091  ORF Transcript_45378/g.73091 Transcript_45378/m.73091 type:complete len:84 (-) Transcript_45378:68-319(-)
MHSKSMRSTKKMNKTMHYQATRARDRGILSIAPSTAGRMHSAQFAHSRQVSLQHLLSISSYTDSEDPTQDFDQHGLHETHDAQ